MNRPYRELGPRDEYPDDEDSELSEADYSWLMAFNLRTAEVGYAGD